MYLKKCLNIVAYCPIENRFGLVFMGGTNHILMQISQIFHKGRAFWTPTLSYAQEAI